MKTKNLRTKIGNVIFYGLMAILLVVGIQSKMNNEIPSFFGVSFMHVVSGSMEPTIMTNDVAIGKKLNASDDISVGDIYIYENTEGLKVIHRIIEQNDDGTYVFKGDNNSSRDFLSVSREQIEFKYLFHIPKLGYIVLLFKNVYFYAALVAVFLASELLSYMRKKKSDDESVEVAASTNEELTESEENKGAVTK